MSYLIVENDKIVNIVAATADYAASQGWPANDGYQIGWVRDGDRFVEPGVDPGEAREAMVVTRFQARAQLLISGLLPAVEAITESGDIDPLMVLEWEDKQFFRRTSPTIAYFAGELGLSDEQVDDLFISAMAIDP